MAEENNTFDRDLLDDILSNEISYKNTLNVIYNYCRNSMQIYGKEESDENPETPPSNNTQEEMPKNHTEMLDGIEKIRDFMSDFINLYNKYNLDSYVYYRNKISSLDTYTYSIYYEETKEPYINNTGVELSPDNYDQGIPFLQYVRKTFTNGDWLNFLSELLKINISNELKSYTVQMSVYDIDVPIYKPLLIHALGIEPVIFLPNFNSRLAAESEILPKLYAWSMTDTFVDSNMLVHIIVYIMLKTFTFNQLLSFTFTSKAMPVLQAIMPRIQATNVYQNEELTKLQNITIEIQKYHQTTQLFSQACELIKNQILTNFDNTQIIRLFTPEIYNNDDVIKEFWARNYNENYIKLKNFITNYPLKVGYEITSQRKQIYEYNGTHTIETEMQTRLASNCSIQTTSSLGRVVFTEELVRQLNPIRQQIRVIDGTLTSINVNIDPTTGIVDYTSNQTTSLNLGEKEEVRRIKINTSSWDDIMSVANFLRDHNIYIEQDQSYDVFEINDDFVSELINADTVAQFSFSYDVTNQRGDLSFTAQNVQSTQEQTPNIPTGG